MFLTCVISICPFTRIIRSCTEPCTVEGVRFDKGMPIIVPVFHLHRDEESWPEPEKFDPERCVLLFPSATGYLVRFSAKCGQQVKHFTSIHLIYIISTCVDAHNVPVCTTYVGSCHLLLPSAIPVPTCHLVWDLVTALE